MNTIYSTYVPFPRACRCSATAPLLLFFVQWVQCGIVLQVPEAVPHQSNTNDSSTYPLRIIPVLRWTIKKWTKLSEFFCEFVFISNFGWIFVKSILWMPAPPEIFRENKLSNFLRNYLRIFRLNKEQFPFFSNFRVTSYICKLWHAQNQQLLLRLWLNRKRIVPSVTSRWVTRNAPTMFLFPIPNAWTTSILNNQEILMFFKACEQETEILWVYHSLSSKKACLAEYACNIATA